MAMRNAKLGVSSSERSLMPVTGHVLFPLSSQRWMHDRSYVWPVTTITGSTMSSMDTGHEKCEGVSTFAFASMLSPAIFSPDFADPPPLSMTKSNGGKSASKKVYTCCPRGS